MRVQAERGLLVSDDSQIPIEINVEGDAEVRFKKIGDAAAQFEVRTNKSIFSFSKAWETAMGVFTGEAALELFHKLEEGVESLWEHTVVDGIKAAENYEVALNRLNVALGQNGHFSKSASEGFEKLAATIQNTTKFGDDAVLSAAALLETLTKLDEKGLKQATAGTVDLAAALNIDLETAASLVAKSIEGNAGALGRYGIKVEDGSTSTEKFTNTMKALSNFTGVAEGQVNTYAGAMARLEHAQEDSHKSVGQLVTQNQALVNVINEVTSILSENTESGKKNAQAYRELIAEGLIAATDAAAAFVTGLDAVGRLGKVVFYGLDGALNAVGLGIVTLIDGPFALLYKGLSLLPGVGDKFAEKFDAIIDHAAEVADAVNKDAAEVEKALNQPSDAAAKITENLLRVRDAAEKGLDAIRKGADASVDPINRASGAVRELSEAEKQLIADGEKVAERLAGEDPNKKYEKELESLSAFLVAKKQITDDDAALYDQLEADRDAKLQEKRAKELADINAQNDALRALNADLYQKEIGDNQRKINEIIDAEGAGSRLYLQQKKKEADQEFQIRQNSAHAISGILGNLAAAAKAFGQDGFEAFKALAEAQALIDTYAAANAAFKSAAEVPIIGPVLAPIAAAAAVAAGLANVAAINATHLATGIDEVPAGFERDNFPAFLQTGERVVPKDTNKDLKSFLAGDSPMVALLQSIDSKLSGLQPQVSVAIDGREVFGAMRQQLRSGRSFT
jgi:hypothetical protein